MRILFSVSMCQNVHVFTENIVKVCLGLHFLEILETIKGVSSQQNLYHSITKPLIFFSLNIFSAWVFGFLEWKNAHYFVTTVTSQNCCIPKSQLIRIWKVSGFGMSQLWQKEFLILESKKIREKKLFRERQNLRDLVMGCLNCLLVI